MTRRYGFARGFLGATMILALLSLAAIQLASDSLNAAAAERHALPTFVPEALGDAVYRALDRIAPAPFVESTLATRALALNDISAAEYYALRMPATPTRNELLATVADRRKQPKLAYEYYFAAADVAELQLRISAEEKKNGRAAYDDEVRLKDRLIALRTHPDALAEAYWRMGEIESTSCTTIVDCSTREMLLRGANTFEYALQLAPLNEKYALSAANAQYLLGNFGSAERAFRGGLAVDPASGDMMAGLGLVALGRHDRAAAEAFAARARALAANTSELLWLERLLK